MNTYVIIVAGGSGKRMKSSVPKQFLSLKYKPVLMHTIEAFYNFDNSINIIITLPVTYFDYWKTLCDKFHFTINHIVVNGGETRFHSVKNGLEAIKKNGIIAIHDGVRPLVSLATILNCFTIAKEEGNAIPIIDIPESIRQIKNKSSKSVDRVNFKIVQTPQVFQSDLIKKAYKQEFKEYFTDDASLLDELGIKLNLVEGNHENIKITTQTDLVIAEALLTHRLSKS